MNIDKGYTLNFIEELIDRGFDGNAWLTALLEEDAEKITLTHPANWMTEEEIETPGKLSDILQRVEILLCALDPKEEAQ